MWRKLLTFSVWLLLAFALLPPVVLDDAEADDWLDTGVPVTATSCPTCSFRFVVPP
jgi:hypothetical protein